MRFIKKLLGIEKLEYTVGLLRKLNENCEKELENYRNYSNYVTLRIPNSEAVTSFMSDLGKKEMFSFYLMTLENEIMMLFRNGKDSEVYRGGLRVIDRIKTDMHTASYSESRKNAKI